MTRSVRITGARVFDGTGADPRTIDVRFVDGRLELDPGRRGVGETVVDAGGLDLVPGFIDVHTHSDALALGPDDERLTLAPVLQGVTTEIAGNCGSSLFPVPAGEHLAEVGTFLRALFGPHAVPLQDFEAFRQAHSRVRRITNITSLVGHGTLRAAVVGFADRRATTAELADMCTLLDAALSQGAPGLSTGLIYPPSTFAPTDELVSLASVAARHGKPYVTHLRDEMSGVEDALEEALEIARRSGVALHVSHHKTAGRHGRGRSAVTLATMDAARAEGFDVTCDVYTYTAGSTHLYAMLPPSVTAGGIDGMLARLAPGGSEREHVRRALVEGRPGWENTVGNGGWHLIEIAAAPHHPEVEGHSVAALAQARGVDPVDFVADLLIAENAAVTVISHSMDEADVRRVLSHPGTMIGSDGVPQGSRPHPRWAGTFARVLGRHTRDLGDLRPADAIARMTGLSARRFGLVGRGVITAGAAADVVLLNPETVQDGATFADPLRPPEGIEAVYVDGTTVVAAGRPTGERPGRAL